uniref:Phosphotransferase n=1 Tax=Rhizophora mucronata TaxID=61149 RepID=A0A2P2KLF0_RHIMU
MSRPILSMAFVNSPTTSSPTASSIEKPFVHFISVPDAIDACLTGNENVNPSSLCLPGEGFRSSLSVATSLASAEAIKSNNSCEDPVIKCGGIANSSNSCLTTPPSVPPNSTRSTRKFVPPRSNA